MGESRDGAGHAYWLFALVAWPALGWGIVECALRIVMGYGDGWQQSLLLTALAGATIAVCGWRRKRSA